MSRWFTIPCAVMWCRRYWKCWMCQTCCMCAEKILAEAVEECKNLAHRAAATTWGPHCVYGLSVSTEARFCPPDC
jgi:hypothetical protein